MSTVESGKVGEGPYYSFEERHRKEFSGKMPGRLSGDSGTTLGSVYRYLITVGIVGSLLMNYISFSH